MILNVEIQNESKQAAKTLLVAELVYKAALHKHRNEKTELTRRVVVEAYKDLLNANRSVMQQPWRIDKDHVVLCPCCKKRTVAVRFVHEQAEGNAKRNTAGQDIPPWAQPYVAQGVAAVTQYTCLGCGFKIALIE